MKLYYWRTAQGNFGDDLNPWLWDRLLPGLLTGWCRHDPAEAEANEREAALFLGIGTILNADVPRRPLKVVFGSGAGYKDPPAVDARWRISCVRGPLTARALGLDEDAAVTDAAMLLRFVDLPAPAPSCRLGFMPHVSVAAPWRRVCAALGIRFLDPTAPVERTLADIRGCAVVAAEAMHGAIVADALRVPWIAVRSYRHTNEFKWRDWCASLGMDYRPVFVGPIWPSEAGANALRRAELAARVGVAIAGLATASLRGRPMLSDDRRFRDTTDRLMERLRRLETDCRSRLEA